MTRKSSLFHDLFSMFGAANAAAAATHESRTPRARDLKTLGIDPRQYHAINR